MTLIYIVAEKFVIAHYTYHHIILPRFSAEELRESPPMLRFVGPESDRLRGLRDVKIYVVGRGRLSEHIETELAVAKGKGLEIEEVDI
jgi:hypothetical protein